MDIKAEGSGLDVEPKLLQKQMLIKTPLSVIKKPGYGC